MNALSGPATTQIRRKVNELVAAHIALFPNALTTKLVLSGGSNNQLAITTTGAAGAFSVMSTVQTTNELCSIQSTTSVTSAALMKALDIRMAALSASGINMFEVLKSTLTAAVQVGNYANAVVGKIDFGTAGYVTGLAGAVCAEIDLPSTNPVGGAGTYTCFEGEMIVPSGNTSTVPVSFINLNLSGAGKANFDTNGYILDIQGLTVASGKVFQANTAAAATHALRIRIGTTAYYIMLTSVGA